MKVLESRIAVFDLNAADCAETAKAVRAHFARDGLKPEVVSFIEMRAFTYGFRAGRYDMAFLGVDSMLGVEAARVAQAQNTNCPLFLVSRTEEYALEGYRLHALDYLLKPVTEAKVGRAVACIGLKCMEGMVGKGYG